MNAKNKKLAGPLVSIVDDDVSVRRSTLRLLSSFALAEDFLNSGRAEETGCLLLDVRMPGMGGLELQRHLAETGQSIPIVFLSARASEEEQCRALQAGAAGFLRKPVSKEALLNAIRAVLQGPVNNEQKDLL